MRTSFKPHPGLSRRGFVQAVASGSLISGVDALTGTSVDRAHGDQGDMRVEDWPAFEGNLLQDDATRARYSLDYGQIVHERPYAVLRPASVQDVAESVRFARRARLRIVARGHGHQPFGQAQGRGSLVVDMQSLHAVGAVAGDRMQVEAGAEWRNVVAASFALGRTPPVLPAHLSLTVGGTLSIGGVGVATWRHGAQVDQVLELEVVTGEGEAVTCSPDMRPDLFEAVLAGQGQCAIITRATLRLITAPPMLREYMLRYPDVRSLLQDEAALVASGRFDGVVGLLLPSPEGPALALSALRYFTPDTPPDDDALTAGLDAIGHQTRDVPYAQYMDAPPPFDPALFHADLGLMVPGAAAVSFLERSLPRLRADDLGGICGMRIFLWPRERFTRPLFRVPDADSVVYLAMLRAETDDVATLSQQLTGNRALFEANRALGGTLYPYAALELRRSDWQRHYGEAWRKLVRAKRRYDPDSVFVSGPNLFGG